MFKKRLPSDTIPNMEGWVGIWQCCVYTLSKEKVSLFIVMNVLQQIFMASMKIEWES